MRQTPGNQAGKQAGDDDDDDDGEANQSEQPPRNLGFKIQMRQRHVVTAGKSIKSGAEEAAADVSSTIIELYIRWIWGLDSALFESFYGMLRKNLSPPV